MDWKRIAILILLLIFLITSVSASSITFIDNAYMKNGTISIFDAQDHWITSLNTTEKVNITNGTPYMIRYTSGGFLKAESEISTDLPILLFLLAYFTVPQHLIGLLVFVFGLLIWYCGIRGYL